VSLSVRSDKFNNANMYEVFAGTAPFRGARRIDDTITL
jgi:hypothetical protein